MLRTSIQYIYFNGYIKCIHNAINKYIVKQKPISSANCKVNNKEHQQQQQL